MFSTVVRKVEPLSVDRSQEIGIKAGELSFELHMVWELPFPQPDV